MIELDGVCVADSSNIQSPKSTFKRLRFGGKCIACGAQVAPGESGWHDPVAKRISCVSCGPNEMTRNATTPVATLPVGGTSALRWSDHGNRLNRRKGAAAEYLIDTCLLRDLRAGEVILSDRRVPGGKGNIDHVVIARSGVWIIDSKHLKGRIEYRGIGGFFDANERLLIGGKDCTYLTDDMYSQVIPIANLLGDRSIPIRPALVFVNGDWESAMRILMKKPYVHNGVTIAWPKTLISSIGKDGPLSDEDVQRIGTQLDQQLAPM
jgi:Nuclease-related domain